MIISLLGTKAAVSFKKSKIRSSNCGLEGFQQNQNPDAMISLRGLLNFGVSILSPSAGEAPQSTPKKQFKRRKQRSRRRAKRESASLSEVETEGGSAAEPELEEDSEDDLFFSSSLADFQVVEEDPRSAAQRAVVIGE